MNYLSRLCEWFSGQLSVWPMAAANFEALTNVRIKTIEVEGFRFVVQFNPARAVSSGAKVDNASVASRPCFLCAANRPPQQTTFDAGMFEILVNPFPVFPYHCTIANSRHVPQSIAGHWPHIAGLAAKMRGFTVFYNGPCCGASAPDHSHFQAVTSSCLPIWNYVPFLPEGVSVISDTVPFGAISIVSDNYERLAAYADRVMGLLPCDATEHEPKINVLCRASASGRDVQLVIIPRRAHRPAIYPQRMISPASIDLAGVFITPVLADFEAMDAPLIKSVISEVCYSSAEITQMLQPVVCNGDVPDISVGIMSAPEIVVNFNGKYQVAGSGLYVDGRHKFSLCGHNVLMDGKPIAKSVFSPLDCHSSFELENVTIGVNFHWQRNENQSFQDSLSLLTGNGNIAAVNLIDVEAYLRSVISSEMRATSSLELLKAHAVISRSWVLAQINRRDSCGAFCQEAGSEGNGQTEIVKWYDHTSHDMFDVCADDHCQRYQGIARLTSPVVDEAIRHTRGMVLKHDGRLCDARFSKCCGGVLELFENCWQPVHHSYLTAGRDCQSGPVPDLTTEDGARQWIMSRPDSFCNTTDASVLSQVLNSYDMETPDFYRWTVSYRQEQLARIVRERSGIDFGKIVDLVPLTRGTSGRIVRLKIVGTDRTIVVGKELEIRKWLSNTHLYSSAFVVEPLDRDDDGIPRSFTLHGAGWGHGVGLCQIGAAMMAEQGYTYDRILSHYYPGAEIEKIY